MNKTLKWILWLSLSLAGPATSQPHPATPAAGAGAAKYLSGLSLIDQDGRPVDLYRDLVANHTVVIHSLFAGCSASCPVTMGTLKLAQSRLAGRMGRDVRILSITVDPTHDTPPTLKAYARRVDAQPGWTFLTGSQAQVRTALQRIGQCVDDPAAHTDLMVVGNTRTGLWKEYFDQTGSPQQWRKTYLFHAATNWQANYVDIIAPKNAAATVDGVAVAAWQPVGDTNYQVAHIKLGNDNGGNHSVTSDVGVGISVYGVQALNRSLELSPCSPPWHCNGSKTSTGCKRGGCLGRACAGFGDCFRAPLRLRSTADIGART
jgi:cytochrome oxidase Cu insertion factor (SCO1/SenC/PrrC family)